MVYCDCPSIWVSESKTNSLVAMHRDSVAVYVDRRIKDSCDRDSDFQFPPVIGVGITLQWDRTLHSDSLFPVQALSHNQETRAVPSIDRRHPLPSGAEVPAGKGSVECSSEDIDNGVLHVITGFNLDVDQWFG